MTSPRSARAPIVVYDIAVDRDEEGDLDWTAWPGVLQMATPVLPSVPPLDLTEEAAGWYFLDEKGPIVLDKRLIAGGRRSYKISVPGQLLYRITRDRCRKELDEYNSGPGETIDQLPADIRKDIQGAVLAELRQQALPKVTETPFLIDTKTGRLLLFTNSATARSDVLESLDKALCGELPYRAVSFKEQTLEDHLQGTRHGVMLPGKIGSKWLAWLAEMSLKTPWCNTTLAGGRVISVRGDIDRHTTLAVEGGLLHVDGSEAVETVIRDVLDTSTDSVPDGFCNLYLKLEEANNPHGTWVVKLNTEGQIANCVVEEPREADDLFTRIENRAQDFLDCLDHVFNLWAAFNAGPVQGWVEGSSQVQMWPGSVAIESHTWTEEAAALPPEPGGGADDDQQQDLYDAGGVALPEDPEARFAAPVGKWATNGRTWREIEAVDDSGITYQTKSGAQKSTTFKAFRTWMGPDIAWHDELPA